MRIYILFAVTLLAVQLVTPGSAYAVDCTCPLLVPARVHCTGTNCDFYHDVKSCDGYPENSCQNCNPFGLSYPCCGNQRAESATDTALCQHGGGGDGPTSEPDRLFRIYLVTCSGQRVTLVWRV
jgi:hypothetical protein